MISFQAPKLQAGVLRLTVLLKALEYFETEMIGTLGGLATCILIKSSFSSERMANINHLFDILASFHHFLSGHRKTEKDREGQKSATSNSFFSWPCRKAGAWKSARKHRQLSRSVKCACRNAELEWSFCNTYTALIAYSFELVKLGHRNVQVLANVAIDLSLVVVAGCCFGRQAETS